MGKEFGRFGKCRRELESRKGILQELNALIPWDVFEQVLTPLLDKTGKSKAVRKAIAPLLLFKLLILLTTFFRRSTIRSETLVSPKN